MVIVILRAIGALDESVKGICALESGADLGFTLYGEKLEALGSITYSDH